MSSNNKNQIPDIKRRSRKAFKFSTHIGKLSNFGNMHENINKLEDKSKLPLSNRNNKENKKRRSLVIDNLSRSVSKTGIEPKSTKNIASHKSLFKPNNLKSKMNQTYVEKFNLKSQSKKLALFIKIELNTHLHESLSIFNSIKSE